MLKPTSLVNARINAVVDQQTLFENNADGALLTTLEIVANLSKADTTVETVKTAADAAQSTYYNKYASNDIIYDASIAPEGTEEKNILDEESFYVPVATGISKTLEYVKIAGVQKKASDIVKVSIGKNAWIYAPLWKVDDELILKVAVPYLCAAAEPETGVASVYVGGITYEVPVMEPIENGTGLKVREAWVEEKAGCAGAISINGNNVALTLGHHGQVAGIIFECNGELIASGTPIYVVKETGDLSMTEIEDISGKTDSYAWYSVKYVNAPVTEEEDGTQVKLVKHLLIPGYGSFDLNIDVVLKAPEA